MEHFLVIPSQLSHINRVRLFLDEIFTESNLNRTYFNRIFLGVSEALSNAIIHGNMFDVNKRVYIHVVSNECQLSVEIVDEGKGFCIDCIKDPTNPTNLMNEKGRGIFFIRQLSDEMSYSDGGRKVWIKYSLT